MFFEKSNYQKKKKKNEGKMELIRKQNASSLNK